ncbi:hypothetical protein Tco_1378327 [Tanacetum coccineum]
MHTQDGMIIDPDNTWWYLNHHVQEICRCSSIRKSLPPKEVKAGERDTIIRSRREVDCPLSEFSSHGLVIVPKGHLFTVNIDKAVPSSRSLPKIRRHLERFRGGSAYAAHYSNSGIASLELRTLDLHSDEFQTFSGAF